MLFKCRLALKRLNLAGMVSISITILKYMRDV